MSLLSKAEIQYLQGQKQISRSYEYKLKSIIKKKVANLIGKEIPLLSTLFPSLDLTGNGKTCNNNTSDNHLTKNSKAVTNIKNENISTNHHFRENFITLNNNKLYNSNTNKQLKRVRSVVRISRRSSEPQTVGSKPIGPVIHTGSNNSLLHIIIEGRSHRCLQS